MTLRIRSVLLPLAAGLILAAAAPAVLLLYAGHAPDGRAAAPPDFATCHSCHSGTAINQGSGMVEIGGAPATWTAGTVYSMQVTVSDSAMSRWGFELVALDDQGHSAGTLSPVDGNTQTSSSGGITYLKQTSSGTFRGTPASATWDFDWTAPAAGTGTVFFYVCGLACNDNGGTSGDHVYTSATAAAEGSGDCTLVLQPDEPGVRLGSNLEVRIHVRNHDVVDTLVYFVSRVNLGGGRYYPPAGWLLAPIPMPVFAGDIEHMWLSHPVPPTAPILTATYEGYVGRPPGVLVDADSFVFSTQP